MSQHSPESHHPEQYDDEISQYEETQHAGDEEGTQREESLEPHPEHTSQYEESHHDNDEEMSQFEEDVDRSDEERSQDERTVYAGDEEMSQDEESRHSDDEDMSQDEDRSQDEDSDSSSQDGPTPRYYHALNGTMLNPLREELRKEGGKAIFACSGYIPVVPRPDVAQSPGSQHSSTTTSSVTSPPTTEPVTIRWDPPAADGLARHAKLVLPLEPETQDNLERLIDSTERASFGYKGKDTYDETYRKALKMDTTAFATTFDPYSLGIIDTIAQVLLPSMQESRLHRAVKAELYKLNIYSAPSGKFKAHVDTPRSNGQIGSLVVCLPLAHEGGQLQVRHAGREFTYDWGCYDNDISWAAFYSDCEHEVLEVTSGHRITLTYNLYAVRGNGTLAGVPSPTLEIGQLPLVRSLREVYDRRSFLPQGGHIGFYCSHAYPHTSDDAVILPDMLKGVDMVVMEALRRLNVEATIKPVLEIEKYREENEMVIGRGPTRRDENLGSCQMEDGIEDLVDDWRNGETLDVDQVHWIGQPLHKQIQVSYIAYGNQECLNAMYSYCAIIAQIPPSAERRD